MEMDFKTIHKSEKWGGHYNFGIEIKVAMDRTLTEQDNLLMYRIADEIEDKLMRETVRLNPEEMTARIDESAKLMECFSGRNVYAIPIENGYCKRWCCSMKPWYRVTTSKGNIVIGWRKRVIHIDWEYGPDADELFPNEDVTKMGRMIHAWGYDKAKAYLDVILSQ